MSYFIHYYDPSFYEPPWRGHRRLGPYDTDSEALEQAASDVAGGAGAGILGIFTDIESTSMKDEGWAGEDVGDMEMAQTQSNVEELITATPVVTVEQIQARAEELLSQRETKAAENQGELYANISATLPDDLKGDDELITAIMRATRQI